MRRRFNGGCEAASPICFFWDRKGKKKMRLECSRRRAENNAGLPPPAQTFLLLLQVGRDQVVQEHDELGVHGDADVVGELGHHAALHLGLAVGVCKRQATCQPRRRTADQTGASGREGEVHLSTHLSAEARRGPARGWT